MKNNVGQVAITGLEVATNTSKVKGGKISQTEAVKQNQ